MRDGRRWASFRGPAPREEETAAGVTRGGY